MGNEYKTISCKLDGRQSISIPVDIKKNGKYITSPVDVKVRGFLKFGGSSSTSTSNELEDKTVVYPVLFSSDTIRVDDGRCIITLLSRSEDLFEETKEVEESAAVSDSTIISQGGIREDEQITDPQKQPVVIKIETGVIRTPYKISIEVTVIAPDGNIYTQTIDRGISPQIEEDSDVTAMFQKKKARIPSNFIIDCYNDSEWIPSVNTILGSNNSSVATITDEINNLQNSTSFGISTMYDAVIVAARLLSDNSLDDKKKTIYLFTDNESNVSAASLDNAIEEVNNIDGDRKTPVLISNLAVVEPQTLSVKANQSDTRNINKLSYLTGGQSLTLVDEDYLDDVVAIFYRGSVGSLGYGTYEFVVDMTEEVLVNQILAFFDIPSADSNASWSIETSTDGYNFTVINDNYTHSETVNFENLYARYIKFKIVLITSISSVPDEYGAYPESPALTSIQILYNASHIAYLYLNEEEVDVQPYQITLAVDANEINDDQIKTGVAKSDSHNWSDYSTNAQPSVNQNGKVVIPIRFSQDITEFQQEPLKKIDTFILKTEYGTWDPFATVLLYDKADAVIATNYYQSYPRDGLIVFNYALPSDYADGDYKIGIINSDKYKVGLKLVNKTGTNNLAIYGIGYLYTTGKDLLPPLAKIAPEANTVVISNEAPNRFSVIEASYTYYDSNFEEEDTSLRRIKWFINGKPIDYLDNLTSWNDITDPTDPIYTNTSLTYPTTLASGEAIEDWIKKQSDSILQARDKIYFEIQVSDGELYSSKTKSEIVEVMESVPMLDQITVMAEDSDGNISSRLAPDRKAVIYPAIETIFYSDSDENQSEIIWYVNDEIFKRGTYGEDRGVGQPPISEIWVNEIGTENYMDYGLRIANAISVQVVPKTGTTVGTAITSAVVVVENALPQVNNVAFVSAVHYENRDVILAFSFFDFEITSIGDIDETGQFDQTNVKWYRKNPGGEFELVYSYNDQDAGLAEVLYVEEYRGHITTNLGTHTSTIDRSILFISQQWYAIVTANDSLENGNSITSSTTTITSATN